MISLKELQNLIRRTWLPHTRPDLGRPRTPQMLQVRSLARTRDGVVALGQDLTLGAAPLHGR